MDQKEILEEAADRIHKDKKRDFEHGDVTVRLERTACFWNAYFGDQLVDAHDVAMLIALHGIMQAQTGSNDPWTYVSIAECAAIAGEIATKKPAPYKPE